MKKNGSFFFVSGHRELDSYSTDRTVCINPYQNSTFNILMKSINKNKNKGKQNKQKTDRHRRNSKSDTKSRHKTKDLTGTNNLATSAKNSAFILTSLDLVKELLMNLLVTYFPEIVRETFLHSASLHWENWSAYNNCLSNQKGAVGYCAPCLPTWPQLTKGPHKIREQLPLDCCQFINDQLTGNISTRANLITKATNHQRWKNWELVGSKLKLLNYLSAFIHMVLYACLTTWFISISPFSR